MYGTTITASPLSYSKTCDTSRPRIGQCATIRAGLGGKSFIYFHVPRAMPNGLVRQHSPERRPGCVKHRLRQTGLSESASIDIANSDMIELFGNLRRLLVQEIHPAASCARLNGFDASSLMCSLRHRKRRLGLSVKSGGWNFFGIRQCGKIFQAKIDANTMIDRPQWPISHLDHNIQEPVATAIAGKAGSILNFSLRQRARVKHAEGIPCKSKRITFPMQVASFQRNPTQGFATTIAQERPPTLRTRFCKLFADSIDAARMQPEFFAAACRQSIQVKSSEPWTVETQGILLPVVAVIPDEVHRTGPLVKQSVQRLYAISAHGNHTVILYSMINLERTTPSESLPFTLHPEGWGFLGQF